MIRNEDEHVPAPANLAELNSSRQEVRRFAGAERMLDEVTSNRPTRLGDICNPKQWPTIPAAKRESGPYPVYGANGEIGFYQEASSTTKTIIVGCNGTIGKVT